MRYEQWLAANGRWARAVNKIKKKKLFFFVFGFKDPMFFFPILLGDSR